MSEVPGENGVPCIRDPKNGIPGRIDMGRPLISAYEAELAGMENELPPDGSGVGVLTDIDGNVISDVVKNDISAACGMAHLQMNQQRAARANMSQR